MKADDLRATLLSLKAYVEEAEERLRVVRLEMGSTLLALEEQEDAQRELLEAARWAWSEGVGGIAGPDRGWVLRLREAISKVEGEQE